MREIYRRRSGMSSSGAQKIMGAIMIGLGVLGLTMGGTLAAVRDGQSGSGLSRSEAAHDQSL